MNDKRSLPVLPHTAANGAAGTSHDDDDVLSTLRRDGSRRWLMPHLATGGWWRKRRVVAYILMVVFVAVPHLRVAGKPLILMDIPARQFTIFGRTFLPTDTMLLALLMLSVMFGIVLITAIAGRAWCGWACPQTVYMEYLFRPIDRLFDGTTGRGGHAKKPLTGVKQVARVAVYVLLSMFLAHTFLAYFVGTERLSQWIQSSPIDHPAAFLVMAATTGLMLFDFLIFREQMCLIACPYGRFQSVMLDEQSLIVTYDPVRGEPRKKGKHRAEDNAGDCVDCNRCVVVCPTGIDIRDGLQMECINCTQCIDACDDVMDRVGSPRGLIRYGSQDGIAGKPRRRFRPRTIIYPLILTAVLSGFAYALSTKTTFDARVLRGKGAPFTTVARGRISNSFTIRLVNRTDEKQTYALQVAEPANVQLKVIDPTGLTLEPGGTSLVPVATEFSGSLTFGTGNQPATLEVTSSKDASKTVQFNLLGPRQ
ncbi:cytochrome c oxidase accessory protein CcoG [Rosistilla oblonga]|uniref:cytochrome c oxidase accessory protein CcoG n=1 Tax=Rosistilla oblonga TaxID=2527990 RepID=UPI003A986D26